MRRRLIYLAAWAFATAITIGISYSGIRSVLVAAPEGDAKPLSAADLRRAAPSPSAPASPSATPSLSPTPSASPSPSATVSPRPATSPTPGWEKTPDGQGGTASTRIFTLQGGEVSFYCARGNVKVAAMTPKAGFTGSETRWSPDSDRVSFYTDKHVSRVWVTWRDGCYAEITESV